MATVRAVFRPCLTLPFLRHAVPACPTPSALAESGKTVHHAVTNITDPVIPYGGASSNCSAAFLPCKGGARRVRCLSSWRHHRSVAHGHELSGLAVNAADYNALLTPSAIPVGAADFVFSLVPSSDSLAECDKLSTDFATEPTCQQRPLTHLPVASGLRTPSITRYLTFMPEAAGAYEEITVRDSVPITEADCRFLRLKVSRP